MKIYKLSNIDTVRARKGKMVTMKKYRNIAHTDYVVVSTQKQYVDLTHGTDNYRYSCLLETIKEIRACSPKPI